MGVCDMEGDFCLASLEYISIACNASPQALQWGTNGLVAFGASSSVILYQPQVMTSCGKVTSVLNGHKSRVNCVSWIESEQEGSCCLVSGSTDKSIIIWEQCKSLKWTPVAHLNGHTDAVCCVAGIATSSALRLASETKYIIVSSSADSSLKVWNYAKASGANCIQTLTFGNGFVFTLALTVLPSSEVPLLACGCDDTLIHLYQLDSRGGPAQFHQALTLQGHEDWVRSLTFTVDDNNDVLLASGAQDCFIRIWKIQKREEIAVEKDEVKLPEKVISVIGSGSQSMSFSVTLETVLAGHEGWVYGLSWYNSKTDTRIDAEHGRSTLCLLSASMDKTVMLWEPSEDSELWIDKARMGEVGGNTLGFYGCAFSPDGNAIIAHGFQGGFHLWNREDREEHSWSPAVTIGGHFGAVEDFDWDPEDYTFMVSVSADQTARLHAPWRRKENETTWHEFARPQIHGYDLQCIAMINRYMYASGGEEKVIRIFRAPRKFHECLSIVAGVLPDEKVAKSLPLGASVPPLGLSNKAIFEGDLASWKVGVDDVSQPMKASAFASEDPLPFTPISITEPPTEDILLQNTLWPEEQKLYGHGYEVFCLACNPQGTVLASACKASKEEHANIILWDTSTWKQLGSLQGHSLTVTQMAFSHDGKWLLSVSRDRTWVLHRSKEDGENDACPFELFQKTDKKSSLHSRIIWSCAWSKDDHLFVTGSRDKKVIVWKYEESISRWESNGAPYVLDDAVTAVDIAPVILASKRYMVAVGMECGNICLLSWVSSGSDPWQKLLEISPEFCPTQSVKRLRWAKKSFGTKQGTNLTLELGCVSSDASLRLLGISLLL